MPNSENVSDFDHLLSLLGDESAKSWTWQDYNVQLEKAGNELFVSITSLEAENPRDLYGIDKDGVFAMHFEYPPVINVPPSPVDNPADMSSEQLVEIRLKRTAIVREFLNEVINHAHSK